MNRNLKVSKHLQKGVTLLEITLAVAVVAVLVIMFMPLIIKSGDDRQAKLTSDEFTQFRAAASSHFQANRSVYQAAMTAGTDTAKLCMVNVNTTTGTGGTNTYDATLHRCAIDTTMLKFLRALPDTVSDNNAYNERWVAIFKAVYDTATPPAPTGGVEMLIVSALTNNTTSVVSPDERRFGKAVVAAGHVAGQGGFVPDTDRSVCVAKRSLNKYEACGTGWKVNLSDFLTGTEVSTFGNRLGS